MTTYQWNNTDLVGTSYKNEGGIIHLSIRRSNPALDSNIKFQYMASKDDRFRYVESEFYFPNRDLLSDRSVHYHQIPDKMKFYIDAADDSCVLEISGQDVFHSISIERVCTTSLAIEYIRYLMRSERGFYSNDTRQFLVDPVVLVYSLHLLLDCLKNEKSGVVRPKVV